MKIEFLYLAATILLTTYGQLIVKWRMMALGGLPDGFRDKVLALLGAVFDPFMLSAFAAAFLAALFWMATIVKLPLSYAYPFVSATFVLVFIASVLLFREPADLYRIVGHGLIVLGIVVTSYSL